ncbi:MAG: lysylphosphatidylglycerol synthase transmembrane domain-containing protein [Solirubrobacterales bacterium]
MSTNVRNQPVPAPTSAVAQPSLRPPWLREEYVAAAPRTSGHRRLLGIAIGIAISIACAFIALEKISLDQVWQSLSGAHYFWVIPSTLVGLLPVLVLRAYRWRILFDDPETVPVRESFAAINIGLMFGNLLPSRAGEIPRVFALRRTTGLSAFEIGSTVVVERLLDTFVLAIFGAALWPLFPEETWIRVLGIVCVGVIVGFLALLAAAAIFRERLTALVLGGLRRLPRVSDERALSVQRSLAAGSAILLRPRRLLEALGLTVLVWAMGVLAIWLLFPAFGLEISGSAPWLILVANAFAITLPSGPAGIGVFEASIQAALIAYGISASSALSYAVVLHAINFVPIMLIGAASAWWIACRPAHARLIEKAELRAPAEAPAVQSYS